MEDGGEDILRGMVVEVGRLARARRAVCVCSDWSCVNTRICSIFVANHRNFSDIIRSTWTRNI